MSYTIKDFILDGIDLKDDKYYCTDVVNVQPNLDFDEFDIDLTIHLNNKNDSFKVYETKLEKVWVYPDSDLKELSEQINNIIIKNVKDFERHVLKKMEERNND